MLGFIHEASKTMHIPAQQKSFKDLAGELPLMCLMVEPALVVVKDNNGNLKSHKSVIDNQSLVF